MVATDKLIPYARNAKKHDEAQVSLIAGSIRQFGFNNPILIAEDNGIVAGHGRVLAARFVHWQNSHWGDDGGCKTYRTQEIETDCIRRLMKMYPGYIRQITRGGSGYSIELNF